MVIASRDIWSRKTGIFTKRALVHIDGAYVPFSVNNYLLY